MTLYVCVSVEVKDFRDRIHQGQDEGEAKCLIQAKNLRDWKKNSRRTRIKVWPVG